MCRSIFSLRLPWVIWQQRDCLQEGGNMLGTGPEWKPVCQIMARVLVFSLWCLLRMNYPDGLVLRWNHKEAARRRQVCPSGGVCEAGRSWHPSAAQMTCHSHPKAGPSLQAISAFWWFVFWCSGCRSIAPCCGSWNKESQWPEPEFVKNHPGRLGEHCN